ncbi:MAG: ribonuclease HII [Dethiobacteria bacterium]|jgi:ribonuclease HII
MKNAYPTFANWPIRKIRQHLQQIENLSDEEFAMLQEDRRAGVRELLARHLARREKILLEGERLRKLGSKEKQLYKKGFRMIAGVDEAGRGSLAGPVVAAAVILGQVEDPFVWQDIDDSKKLSPEKREKLYKVIFGHSVAVGLGIVDVEMIDKINIHKASLLAMKLAIEQLRPSPHFLLVDGFRIPGIGPQLEAIKGGDRLCLSIAAASIVAKVTRDHLMDRYDQLYPGYGFARNKGYSTPEHRKAIQSLGQTELHRKTFRLS